MKKQEFLNRIKTEKLNIGDYLIVTDSITDEPLVLGCAFDKGKWRVYETNERGGHVVIKELDNENEAYDYLYKLVFNSL